MTDDADFLRAILAAPDDDAPRLVYADWLDDRAGPGDADRAEFVRVQIEIGRLRGLRANLHGPEGVERVRRLDADHPDRKEDAAICLAVAALMPRERETFEADHNRVRWRWGLGGFFRHRLYDREGMDPVDAHAIFRRGLVESITAPAGLWSDKADAILAGHPVREVRLTTWPNLNEHAELYRRIRSEGKEIPDWPDPPGHVLERLLPMVWPSVETWHLPPQAATADFPSPADVRNGNSYGPQSAAG